MVVFAICVAAAMCPNPFAGGTGQAPQIFERESAGGVPATLADCERHEHAVWVETAQGAACVRYFASQDLAYAPVTMFYLHDDGPAGTRAVSGNATATVSGLRARVGEQQRLTGTPVVMVARPGVFGSSDERRLRGGPEEAATVNAAIDAIKLRHGIRRIALAGESGGARLMGALLSLGRTDVECAVGVGGGYGLQHAAEVGAATPGAPRAAFSVIDQVHAVAPDETRRVFVLGDPVDRRAWAAEQRRWASEMRRFGHHAVLLRGERHDSEAPGPRHLATMLASWCGRGMSDRDIAHHLGGYLLQRRNGH
jgi:pimeloyl-ACP methyl ester carboxylesterase